MMYVELHPKDQSKMNQAWSYHNLYIITEGPPTWYFMEPSLKTKIVTKNYNCDEKNEMKQARCLDQYYMNKLNCTFPWMKSTKASQEKCGSRHYVKDLVDLIDYVAKGE